MPKNTDTYRVDVTLELPDGRRVTDSASALDINACGQDGVAGAVAKEALERNPGAKVIHTTSTRA
ncbi:hypothetical protein [Streptomyces sp. ST2-7A]|uniref:hypothetical protein n=1 Tax=Streptomyces sp. ST2-7A TaxID=2907214 RepID=UPI001F4401AD|nr:hypothetical protein [Streptomyces sp. ST2-7A]MCE7081184.1 hypothetical protein [Streptomyces sp. ST2-7A]